MKKVKTFLVDDEIGALDSLQAILSAKCPELEVVGKANRLSDAYRQMQVLKPELVFLDIQLKNHSGFELLEMEFDFSFEVIFVTAHDQYAIEAFNKNALSYVLKPISFNDIVRARDRALKVIRSEDFSAKNSRKRNQIFSNKIPLTDSSGTEYFETEEIVFIKADGSYSEVNFNNSRTKTISRPLKYIERLLPTETFVRIHRSYIVNINHITKWSKSEGGYLKLSTDQEVPISRSGAKALNGNR